MARMARIVVPGYPHHITQRGNRRADVFFDEQDRRVYMAYFRKYSEKHGLRLWAYCLMTNHVHHVAVPQNREALSRTMRDTDTAYARYFNRKYSQVGHVWQGRFYSCPMDEIHRWAAVRYVESNPVRGGLVSKAEEYSWSSAACHCGLRSDDMLCEEFPPPGVVADWSLWLRQDDSSQVIETIRRRTRTGRPCGDERFLDDLEELLGRSLRPRIGGRPRRR
jgi:putative transposase